MADYNYDDPIPVTEDLYWIGFSDHLGGMHCNPYLLIDQDEAILFDPGSVPDFPNIMRKIIDLISPEKISLIVVSHQDPDVCANLPIVEDLIGRNDLHIAGHSLTVRLLQHLGLNSTFYPVDKQDFRFMLKSGRLLSFHPTPYLHSAGSIATYDVKSKSLLSGDLFAASDNGNWSLFNNANFPGDMNSYHQTYMPSGEVLRHGLEKLETLDIERILPQHGSVIEGSDVFRAFEHLKTLKCGIDLMD